MITKPIVGIAIIVVMIVGLAATVYLVQRQQQLKSKASAGSFVNAFEIKDASGNLINCDSNTSPPTCNTSTLDINVRVKDTTPLLP